jgi:hypothetical protein
MKGLLIGQLDGIALARRVEAIGCLRYGAMEGQAS